LQQVDAHAIAPDEYADLPELTEEMRSRASLNKGGRPVSANPRKPISLRLPRGYRALARHRPGLADPHGGAIEQGLRTE